MGRRSRRDANGSVARVILIDSSAWIEFLRDTGSTVCNEVDELLDAEIATTEPVRMEILAGARSDGHFAQLRSTLARAHLLRVEPGDYDAAAGIYQGCRANGKTVRKLVDCLIAAVALRHKVSMLHSDRDFEAIAASFELAIHEPTAQR